jgi:hypothetical protein
MKDWYCAVNGLTYGPFSEPLLGDMVKKGQLTFDTLVWNSGPDYADKGWQRALDTELAALLPQLAPPPPPPSLVTPPLPPVYAGEYVEAATVGAQVIAVETSAKEKTEVTNAYAWSMIGVGLLMWMFFLTGGLFSYIAEVLSLHVTLSHLREQGLVLALAQLALYVTMFLFVFFKEQANLKTSGVPRVKLALFWAILFSPIYFYKRVFCVGRGWPMFYTDLILKVGLFMYVAMFL